MAATPVATPPPSPPAEDDINPSPGDFHVSPTPTEVDSSPEDPSADIDPEVRAEVYAREEEPHLDFCHRSESTTGPMADFTEVEIVILKNVIKSYALPEIQSRNKDWETPQLWAGVTLQYNKIAASNNLTYNRTTEQILEMAKLVSFCDCGLNPTDPCRHVIVKVPAHSTSVSGGSRKRSYDSISGPSSPSLSSLDGEVGVALNMLRAHGKISKAYSLRASVVYSLLLSRDLKVIVQRFLQEPIIERKVEQIKEDLGEFEALINETLMELHP